MTTAITKKWLRRRHRDQGIQAPFRSWCKTGGRDDVRYALQDTAVQELYPRGVNYDVAQLTGLEEGEECGLSRLAHDEVRKARKARARVLASATRTTRRARASKKGQKVVKKVAAD